ncbi:hypothetical protein [Lewinella sp. JB7]|uniref:hypothetical protein n=1 Tax=Lewinella sp. JB7 TaxID=2962887 RepID=UPI0020C957E7|nr:hypothetical protein [Lewinella sp. JB7]MCP9234863.1 hypothetical protein [Lewinella sp. JB7]
MYNAFHWNLYKESKSGSSAIRRYASLDPAEILECSYSRESIQAYRDAIARSLAQVPDEGNEFIFLLRKGFPVTYEGDSYTVSINDFDYSFDFRLVTTLLYCQYPDRYIPYIFINKIDLLYRILDYLNLDSPPLPKRRDWEERWSYYGKICGVLHDYRREIGLKSEEFMAFILDFVPRSADNTHVNSSLPDPANVWIVGGNKNGGDFKFLDQAQSGTVSFWQGNKRARKGDIVVMYCLSPRSYIHSIWRTITDGYIDPFFHWYSQVHITFISRVPRITVADLRTDAHFATHPLVRKNLQGLNGYRLSGHDYRALLRMLRAKDENFRTDALPQPWSPTFELNRDLTSEREVEVKIVEPFIRSMGFGPVDWGRQYTLKMGRGASKYPDYVFYDHSSNEADRMRFLIETKLEIRHFKDYAEAFDQARSYGLRLNCKLIAIADKNCICLHQRRNGSFFKDDSEKFYWNQLGNPDTFQQIKRRLEVAR